MGTDCLGKDEGCDDIDLEGSVPAIKSHFLEWLLLEDPGIVDQGT